jgi:glutamyl-tRNA(Gln) amidotransferase subunit D
VLDYYTKNAGVKGLIIEGTGLGHVSSKTVSKLREIVGRGVFVGMTSQTIWGHVDLDVYETGRDLLSAGVTPLGNMLGETALAKLSWSLGNFEKARIRDIMLSNIVGEFTDRISLMKSEA